jgi:transcriptional regulator with XRE-family HTH domain
MDIKKVLGQNTRRYRLALGITQAEVASQMGIDRAYISAVERGLQNMTAVSMLELSTVLKIEPALLITPVDESTETSATD